MLLALIVLAETITAITNSDITATSNGVLFNDGINNLQININNIYPSYTIRYGLKSSDDNTHSLNSYFQIHSIDNLVKIVIRYN